MSIEALLSQVHGLSDLELASLLCLVAKEHCLFETAETSLNETAQELSLIASEVFRLSNRVLDCSEYTSIEEFGDAILDQNPTNGDDGLAGQAEGISSTTSSRLRLSSLTIRAAPRDSSTHRSSTSGLDNRKIVNVIIAKNFNLVDDVVQIQALELIRRGRIFSRTTVHVTPEPFLFLPVVIGHAGDRRLNKHLVRMTLPLKRLAVADDAMGQLDHLFISHFHGTEDGFRYLEDATGYLSSSPSQSSLASVVQKPSRSMPQVGDTQPQNIPLETIKSLQARTSRIYISPEIRRYIQNIVVFLRLERGVAGGVSPKATSHFQVLTRCLASLHSLSYVSPSLVQLAVPKIYRHRLRVLTPQEAQKERSVMYGSDVDAVAGYLEEVMLEEGGAEEEVIRRALGRVDCPL